MVLFTFLMFKKEGIFMKFFKRLTVIFAFFAFAFFNVDVCHADADTMKMLAEIPNAKLIDRTGDESVSILDLIDAKSRQDKDSEAAITDYLFDKTISTNLRDADEIVLKDVFDFILVTSKDTPLNTCVVDNHRIISLYNPSKCQLTKIKLDNIVSEEETNYPIYEFDVLLA